MMRGGAFAVRGFLVEIQRKIGVDEGLSRAYSRWLRQEGPVWAGVMWLAVGGGHLENAVASPMRVEIQGKIGVDDGRSRA